MTVYTLERTPTGLPVGVKSHIVGEVINSYKIQYKSPDEDGYIGAKADSIYASYDLAIAILEGKHEDPFFK